MLSVLALFAGPVLYQWLRHGGFVARAFDTLIIAVLLLMLAFLLIPESWHALGYYSILLIFTGYALPGVLEILIKRAAETTHMISLMIALGGLVIHALLDGAGLAGSDLQHPQNLAVVIVVHRLSVGLILWMMVQPVFGKRWAFTVLAVVALATVGGYLLSESVISVRGEGVMSVVQGLIIGAIGHNMIHRGHSRKHQH